MRKKYLSALLFGALLFASAGTFTSCKDYDDDINNLQEQINTVKTDLESLKSTVEGLDGVKTLSYADGMLIIETGKGTKVEVPVPSATGITTVELKDNVLYVDGKEAGKVEIAEGEAIKVEVKEDGKLYINDEVQDLEIGSKVAVVDNGDGSYTLTVDGKSYVLPKATSSISINLTKEKYFTNFTCKGDDTSEGIYWGTADDLLNPWEGVKTVEKGKLLVGQIRRVPVSVLPATFDLGAEDGLSLVNSLGKKAPVVIKAVSAKNEEGEVDSRAADLKGDWFLEITMDETVTPENVGRIFANEDNTKNMMYALALDGKVLTDYSIIVDTQEKKTSTCSVTVANVMPAYYKGSVLTSLTNSNTVRIPVGQSTDMYLSSTDSSVDYLYDSYIEIKDTDKAGAYKISAKGMTITAGAEAAKLPATEYVKAVLHMIDINGKVYERDLNLYFGDTESGEVAIAAQEYEIIPNFAGIVVDLADAFTGLSDDAANEIANGFGGGSIKWETTNDAATIATVSPADKTVNNSTSITYYKTKEGALAQDPNDVVNAANSEKESIKSIKYAVITNSSFKSNAEAGVNNFTITMSDKNGNQLKKVTAKVTVTLPAFDKVLEANTKNTPWKEGKYIARLAKNASNAGISFVKAFVAKQDANEDYFFDDNYLSTNLTYKVTYVDPVDSKVKEISYTNLNDLIDTAKGKLKVASLNAVATIKLMARTEMNVTKEFTVNLKSIFGGAEFKYYSPKTYAPGVANLAESNNIIIDGAYDGGDTKKPMGIFGTFNAKTAAFDANNSTDGTKVGDKNVICTTNSSSYASLTNDQVYVEYALKPGSFGNLEVVDGGLKISPVKEGNSGVVVLTFTDALGIKTTQEIAYEKAQ